jgi:hypothetical protein
MSNPSRAGVLLAVLATAVVSAVALAQAADRFDLSWHVIAGGGGQASRPGLAVHGSIGQPLVATSGNRGARVASGFWHGRPAVGPSPPPTPTGRPSPTPHVTFTPTRTRTPTPAGTRAATSTPTAAVSRTATWTPTVLRTPTATRTPVVRATRTPTPDVSPTPPQERCYIHLPLAMKGYTMRGP